MLTFEGPLPLIRGYIAVTVPFYEIMTIANVYDVTTIIGSKRSNLAKCAVCSTGSRDTGTMVLARSRHQLSNVYACQACPLHPDADRTQNRIISSLGELPFAI